MRGASVLRLLQCASVLLLAGSLILVDRVDARRGSAKRLKRRDYYYHNWREDSNQDDYPRKDIIAVTTCEARCWKNINFNACVKTCLAKGCEKRGSCPNLIQINDDGLRQLNITSPYYLPCLNECKKDSDCLGIGKCCKHHCGSTCQPGENLQNDIDLPEVPTDFHLKPRKKKALFIKWKPPPLSLGCNDPVFYILEERHHNGKYENNLGEWSTCLRTGKPSVLLRNFIRPGRVYQFRIASVNENGTKGFSHPVTYIPQIGPRPPKAPEVTVGPLYQVNNTLQSELKWTIPQPELSIQKFKVFWSKRLYGISALDSVLVLQDTVSGDTNRYTIRDLEPDSMYFIQVQAIAQYGKDILRGEKSGYVMNTTTYFNLTNVNDLTIKNTYAICKIDDLQLQKLYWSKDEDDVKARLTWKPTGKNIKYNISWWGSCKNNKTSQHRLTATTRHTHFDIYDLHFDCRYKVNVKETHQHRRLKGSNHNGVEKVRPQNKYFYDTSITFTTPTCKDLQVHYKRLKCKHRK